MLRWAVLGAGSGTGIAGAGAGGTDVAALLAEDAAEVGSVGFRGALAALQSSVRVCVCMLLPRRPGQGLPQTLLCVDTLCSVCCALTHHPRPGHVQEELVLSQLAGGMQAELAAAAAADSASGGGMPEQ